MKIKLIQIFAVCVLQIISLQAQSNIRPSPDTPLPIRAETLPPPGIPLESPVEMPLAPIVRHRSLDVLDFWFGFLNHPEYYPEHKVPVWLGSFPEIESDIRASFYEDVLKARKGDYNSWRETPRGRLALIILLDQIPRHIFRSSPQAFGSDPMARGLVIEGIQRGDDRHLYPIERAFFYLPLEHSEDPDHQRMSVALYQKLLRESPMELKPEIQNFLEYAKLHEWQIGRFGRFPGRNGILGRESTPEEIIYFNSLKREN